eukprot:scaffold457271_cov30-Prasinocladus_malaysianus.AAC.2
MGRIMRRTFDRMLQGTVIALALDDDTEAVLREHLETHFEPELDQYQREVLLNRQLMQRRLSTQKGIEESRQSAREAMRRLRAQRAGTQ